MAYAIYFEPKPFLWDGRIKGKVGVLRGEDGKVVRLARQEDAEAVVRIFNTGAASSLDFDYSVVESRGKAIKGNQAKDLVARCQQLHFRE